MYTIEKFLRLRCSSPDLDIALFFFTEYDLAITFAAVHNTRYHEILSSDDILEKLSRKSDTLCCLTYLSGEELLELAGL